jgi:hypothetical protein
MTDQRASEHRGGPAGDTVDGDADGGHDHGIEGESAASGSYDHGAGTGAAVDAFSGANPTLKVRGLDTTGAVPTGCGTGRTMADPLAFDDSGDGPSV